MPLSDSDPGFRPPPVPAVSGPTPHSSYSLLELVCASLDSDKAIDTVTIPLAGKSSITDYMVVASGSSQRHISAMAEHLVEKLKAGGQPSHTEGLRQADWVLIDAGDVIVHLFRPEIRDFYNLEKMWSMDLVAEPPGDPAVP